jgi:hypothetical protein
LDGDFCGVGIKVDLDFHGLEAAPTVYAEGGADAACDEEVFIVPLDVEDVVERAGGAGGVFVREGEEAGWLAALQV